MARDIPPLGERELDITEALWDLKGGTVAEVHERLRARGNDIAYTTVQTMLNRLVSKGVVACDVSERAHRYAPALPKQAFVRAAVEKLKKRFFEDSSERLAVGLVEQELTDRELQRLRDLIDKRRKERK